jgi:hypothetical protein
MYQSALGEASMRKLGGTLLVLVAAGLFAAAPARAGYAPGNADELKCDVGLSKGLAKFTGSKIKCLTKCWQAARKGLVPASDCVPPYGGPTAYCILYPI